MENETKLTREQWLNGALALVILTVFKQYGREQFPKIRCTVGATGVKQLSRCISPSQSSDNTFEILISIYCDDSRKILARLVHECIHAITANTKSHTGQFKQLANSVGLLAPLSVAKSDCTAELARKLSEIVKGMGKIPHAKVNYQPEQKGRNGHVLRCSNCGYKSNHSQLWRNRIEDNIANGAVLECPVCSAATLSF